MAAGTPVRQEAVAAWLAANGIAAEDVLLDSDITIAGSPGSRTLTVEVCDLTADGHRQIDERLQKVATKLVTVPLTVEPEWWEPHVKPTRDDLLAGEDPYTDDRTVPTPGQWIWLWNRATREERLERAQRIVEDRATASWCRQMNHIEHIRYLEQRLGGASLDGTKMTAQFVPPAADGLPPGLLDSASAGANMLDAWGKTPYGRNVLAHALVQLARDGWLHRAPDPKAAFDVVEERPARTTPEPEEAP